MLMFLLNKVKGCKKNNIMKNINYYWSKHVDCRAEAYASIPISVMHKICIKYIKIYIKLYKYTLLKEKNGFSMHK